MIRDYHKNVHLIQQEREMNQIIVQRHGEYDSGWPKNWANITKKEKETLGRLTKEGIENVRKITQERLRTLCQPKETFFLLIHSPTYWLDEPIFGQRAKETAEVIEEEIKKAGGLVVENRLDFRLGEALMFQTPFAKFLREQCGGQGEKFWEAFENDTWQKKRRSFGAEGPKDISGRMCLAFNNAVDWLLHYKKRSHNFVWIVSHGDCIGPLAAYLKIDSVSHDYNRGIRYCSHDNSLKEI